MKIVKQLSDNRFEIELEPQDMRTEKSVVVAHDYVRFTGNGGLQADISIDGLEGPFAWCNNWVRTQHEVTLGIREMVQFVLPFLNKHEYCQELHLLDSQGEPNYTWGDSVIFFRENGEEKVYIRLDHQDEGTIIPRKVYNHLKGISK